MKKDENCIICGKPLFNVHVSCNGAYAHEYCYMIRYQRFHYDTFQEVLTNMNDQVLVRRLLIDLVPDEIKDQIVYRFNDNQSGKLEAKRRAHYLELDKINNLESK